MSEEKKVRRILVDITESGHELHQEIRMEGYEGYGTATLMTDITNVFASVLCNHAKRGRAKVAVLQSFLPHILLEIERFEEEKGRQADPDDLAAKAAAGVLESIVRDILPGFDRLVVQPHRKEEEETTH